MRVSGRAGGGAGADGPAGAGGGGGGGRVLAGGVETRAPAARAPATPARLPQPAVPALSPRTSPRPAPPPAPDGVGSSSLLGCYACRRRTAGRGRRGRRSLACARGVLY